MIVSFGSKETRLIWEGQPVNNYMMDFMEAVKQRLHVLNRSESLMQLSEIPSHRVEKLKGNLQEYYSIRINRQWRIIFKWEKGNAYDVELIDYH